MRRIEINIEKESKEHNILDTVMEILHTKSAAGTYKQAMALFLEQKKEIETLKAHLREAETHLKLVGEFFRQSAQIQKTESAIYKAGIPDYEPKLAESRHHRWDPWH